MRKLKIITIVVALALITALIVMRMERHEQNIITSDEFSVYGIKNGIAVACGDVIDGIIVSLPSDTSPGDVISVSSDTGIAYLKIDSENVEKDRTVSASVIAVAEGIAELYIRSADGDKESLRYTINVYSENIAETEQMETVISAEEEKENPDIITVYITKHGTKYHLSKKCAGDTAEGIHLRDAVDKGYLPCKNCAVNK